MCCIVVNVVVVVVVDTEIVSLGHRTSNFIPMCIRRSVCSITLPLPASVSESIRSNTYTQIHLTRT